MWQFKVFQGRYLGLLSLYFKIVKIHILIKQKKKLKPWCTLRLTQTVLKQKGNPQIFKARGDRYDCQSNFLHKGAHKISPPKHRSKYFETELQLNSTETSSV